MSLLDTTNGKRVLFSALYFSEGAPIGFVWWTLPTVLRTAEVPLGEITLLTSLLILPWTLKFLWSPLIDVLQRPRWGLRAWIISMQILAGLSLLPLLFLDIGTDYTYLLPILIIHTITAATQDVAVDALCIASTSAAERGLLNGWMQAGMLLGRSLFGGVALLLFNTIGIQLVIIALAVSIWCSTLLLLLTGNQPTAQREKPELLRQFGLTLKKTMTSRITILGILFAVISGAGFEAVGAIAGPFLVDHGVTTEQIGLFFALPTVLCMAGGGLVGGYLSDRYGRIKTVRASMLLCSFFILLLALAALLPGNANHTLFFTLMAGMYLAIGLFISSSYALFMDISDPELKATQFSTFMGSTNLCESWSGYSIGRLVPLMGYSAGFILFAFIPFLAFPLLKRIEKERRHSG